MTYTHLTTNELVMIEAYYQEGATVSAIVASLGRSKQTIYNVIHCYMRKLYRLADRNIFDKEDLPWKGKRKPNGKKEMRGRQSFRRDLRERADLYPYFDTEFGHLEGDTIVGKNHKSAAITLVERLSKAMITLQTNGRKASDIEYSISRWLSQLPIHLFKSIAFDCGKEFSNWKSL